MTSLSPRGAMPTTGDGLNTSFSQTLTLSVKSSKVSAGSIRLIPKDTWSKVLSRPGTHRHSSLSSVESTPVDPVPYTKQKDFGCSIEASPEKRKEKRLANTRGVTALASGEYSLVLGDSTLTLKSVSAEASPLALLEPILDVVVPVWRSKRPEHYLKHISFVHLPHAAQPSEMCRSAEAESWASAIEILSRNFHGEAVALGTDIPHRVYIANYLSRDKVSDAFATHVSLDQLDPTEHAVRFGFVVESATPTPLESAWQSLHGGGGPRCVAARAKFDEGLREGNAYRGSAVFGRHFTTALSAQSPGNGSVSVETTMPLTKEAKQRFVTGASGMCYADSVSVVELALEPTLFLGGAPPELPGFALLRSSQSVGTTFACALHQYVRGQVGLNSSVGSRLQSPVASCASDYDVEVPPADLGASAAHEAQEEPPVVPASSLAQAPVLAAELLLQKEGGGRVDLPVTLLDLAAVERQADVWRSLLPRVEPFYAVKCNPNSALLATLWKTWQKWGAGGFDCASPSEMDLAVAAGVDPGSHIIYANPCKQGSAVEYAKVTGVKWVVFDNIAELSKLKEIHPEADLVLRVQTDDSLAQCPLSNKFGCAVEECGALLELASCLGLKVVGVSFHVGSGCSQVGAFRSALQRARVAFDKAREAGFQPWLLDIGGGFPGWDEAGEATFSDHAADIAEVLEELFPDPAVRVIAEPGRFFAASAQALITTVVSVAGSPHGDRYYLNDGVYGSFNSLIYDHAKVPDPVIFRGAKPLEEGAAGPPYGCTIFGPTCDGFDLISSDLPLPKLQVGDRLLFPNMGAYTSAASTRFNGFDPAKPFVYRSCQA